MLLNFLGYHYCGDCGRKYISRRGLLQHIKYECGVEAQFQCPICVFKSKHKFNLKKHIRSKHSETVAVQ